jgi:hypothetical protein
MAAAELAKPADVLAKILFVLARYAYFFSMSSFY